MTVIPHLRALPPPADRKAARARLGLDEQDLLVCSFGIVTERKASRDLLAAWRATAAGRRAGARLVFVGENQGGSYGEQLLAELAAPRGAAAAAITGYASAALYRDYLAAADIAVQLRTGSRGETSGTILDCLAVGLPVIMNAHGPAAELPDDVVVKLPEAIAVAPLAAAIDRLASDRPARLALAERERAHIAAAHHPAAIGEAMRDAIERYTVSEPAATDAVLASAVSHLTLPVAPDADDLWRVSDVMARQRPREGDRQILYDVTVLSEQDARTGIQRVVRGMLQTLLDRPPAGHRIEVVRMDGPVMRYARNYLGRLLEIPSATLPDEVCTVDAGDIYLSIDWVPDRLPLVEGWLADFRRAGGRVVIGVHDLLPLQLPQFFPDYMPHVTQSWFESAMRVADQFVCVSATVADDVVRFGNALRQKPGRPIAVDFFHNASDLEATLPSRGLPDGADATLRRVAARPSFLMVGTVEPRKGHIQVLRGFEKLWADGLDVGLVIVGKTGWMMDAFADGAARHPERDGRLVWLQGISDEFLDRIYEAAAALVVASEGEGFGLPLIEAARHGTALIARDLPVFREVAGDHAFYFAGLAPGDVAQAIRRWLTLSGQGRAPKPDTMPIKTWQESTDDVVQAIFADQHFSEIA